MVYMEYIFHAACASETRQRFRQAIYLYLEVHIYVCIDGVLFYSILYFIFLTLAAPSVHADPPMSNFMSSIIDPAPACDTEQEITSFAPLSIMHATTARVGTFPERVRSWGWGRGEGQACSDWGKGTSELQQP